MRVGIVAWIGLSFVIPRLDHGIQLKILILLVFFIIFMDPVVKPRGDTVDFIGLRNNAMRVEKLNKIYDHKLFILLKKLLSFSFSFMDSFLSSSNNSRCLLDKFLGTSI